LIPTKRNPHSIDSHHFISDAHTTIFRRRRRQNLSDYEFAGMLLQGKAGK
jgi:hypothetical protein